MQNAGRKIAPSAAKPAIKFFCMLTRIEEMPSYVAAFKATGEVSEKDYKNTLVPEVDRVDKEHGHIHFLMVLETPATNFSLRAWLQDALTGLKHYRGWKKVALVSDEKSIETISDIFSVVIPGKSKGFPLSQLEEAKKWVAEE